MQVFNRALAALADALRHRCTMVGNRWQRLPAGGQGLLVLAHLRKGETDTALADGFGIGTTTVYRDVREGSTFWLRQHPPWNTRSRWRAARRS